MSENLRSALNALLYRTGDQSRDIVLVVATNRPEDLDRAVVDRVDEALEFPLPGEQEREKLIRLYLDKYVMRAGEDGRSSWRKLLRGGSDKIEVRGITDDVSMMTSFRVSSLLCVTALLGRTHQFGLRKQKLHHALFAQFVSYRLVSVRPLSLCSPRGRPLPSLRFPAFYAANF